VKATRHAGLQSLAVAAASNARPILKEQSSTSQRAPAPITYDEVPASPGKVQILRGEM